MSAGCRDHDLIEIHRNLKNPVGRSLYRAVQNPLEKFLAVSEINRRYRTHFHGEEQLPPGRNFFAETLEAVQVSYEVSEEDLENIPRRGPVLVVANHPFGGIDGIVLGALLSSLREDALLMANHLLHHIPEIRRWLISVDPFGGREAAGRNLVALRRTMNHLREGGLVGTFPAGTVSHVHLSTRQIADPGWTPNLARIIAHSKATVVPVYFEGKNSAFFQAAGLVHPKLRTMMLPREFIKQEKQSLPVRIGKPIPYRKLANFADPGALTRFLRLKTYILENRPRPALKRHFPVPRPKQSRPGPAPLAAAIAPEVIADEIAGLAPEQLLITQGKFAIFHTTQAKAPQTLLEIGRLRERTFRDVHEGTGDSRDLDHFDSFYHHLFIWDRESRAIAGAYRLGLTSETVSTRGLAGLYSSTLFKYKAGFLEQLGPAIELGRSFIVGEYQKKHATLALLWKGIIRFVLRHPEHKTLFGPVSISREYHPLSRALMVQALGLPREGSPYSHLHGLVKGKNPPKTRSCLRGAKGRELLDSVRDIDDINAIVSEIEADRKGVPTLLRHYLKLSGEILSFNIDPDFGHCLDGLIVVDLTKTEPKLLKPFFGHDGITSFQHYHRRKDQKTEILQEARR